MEKKFNVEEEYNFIAQRLSSCLYKPERIKGEHMKKYMETSVLFCPDEVYSKEELEEKLNKVNEIKSIIEKKLEELSEDQI